MNKRIKPNWIILLLIQFILICIISALASLSLLLGNAGRIVGMYILLPFFCAVVTGRCVYTGLNNYLALIPVPVAITLCYLAIWGYLPNITPILISLPVCVIGSAFGEVLKQQKNQKQR